jgi:ferric-dicitrate binding protein FerR (iron transport regulator)
MKLVEEREGEGRLTVRGEAVGRVAYALNRYQAMTAGGMPVPGLHRIEGRLAVDNLPESLGLEQDMHVALELEDGRKLDLTLIDASGRVLAEGHGPGKCGCC